MTRIKETIESTLPQKAMTVDADPMAFLQKEAKKGLYSYLLAFADDGLIWGAVNENLDLVLSSGEETFHGISPALREQTLWEARLFGAKAECYLWKTASGWSTRYIEDGSGTSVDVFDESYILWGTNQAPQEGEKIFYYAEEIGKGIRHTPPKRWTDRHDLRLMMRHYLDYDDDGAVFVRFSRLVDLYDGGQK